MKMLIMTDDDRPTMIEEHSTIETAIKHIFEHAIHYSNCSILKQDYVHIYGEDPTDNEYRLLAIIKPIEKEVCMKYTFDHWK